MYHVSLGGKHGSLDALHVVKNRTAVNSVGGLQQRVGYCRQARLLTLSDGEPNGWWSIERFLI